MAAPTKLPLAEWCAGIPLPLREKRRWAGWRGDKRPRVLGSGANARTDSPATWGSFEEACAWYARHEARPDAGVGFVTGDGVGALDLDGARDPATGEVLEWAAPLVFNTATTTYTEISPSGKGYHVLLLSEGGMVEFKPGAEPSYKPHQFVTVTGWRVGTKSELSPVPEDLKRCFARDGEPTPPRGRQRGERAAPDAVRIASALDSLDPDVERDAWLRVGMALHDGYGGSAAGLELWDRWSSGGAKYRPGEPARLWASFKRTGVTLGTLFYMAEPPAWAPREPQPDPRDDFEPVPEDEIPDYHRLKVGKAIVCVRGPENVSLFFRRDPRWRGRLRFNSREDAPELDGRSVSDADLVDLGGAVSRAFGWSPAAGKDMTHDGIARAARADEYDPVVEWLGGLRWDGEERLGDLPARLGLEDDAVTRRYLRRWMIGAVARAFRPGCEMQNMLVLVGPQGARKSQLLKRLAVRPEWYRESEVQLADKDGQLAVLAPWIVEVGELAGMTRAEVERVKVFISEAESRFRRPWGRFDERHPRRCVFAGTTNDEQFTRDQTGARRFWTVAVPSGELALPEAAEVALLWAEARVAYETGERWWDEGDELRETLERGEERRVETVLDVEVGRVAEDLRGRGATTMREVVGILVDRRALPGSGNTPTSLIAHALRRAGWRSHHTKLAGRTWRVWRLPGAASEAQVTAIQRARGFVEDSPDGGSGGGSSGGAT